MALGRRLRRRDNAGVSATKKGADSSISHWEQEGGRVASLKRIGAETPQFVPAPPIDNQVLTVKQRLFLAAYARTGYLKTAALAARCEPSTHSRLWLQNEEYRAAFEDAKEDCVQKLENEVRRRAEEGDPEIVLYQGAPVMEPLYDKDGEVLRDRKTGRIRYSNRPLIVRRKSDLLAMFLLKSMRPEQYRDNAKVQLAGQDGGPLEIRVSFVSPPSQ